MPASGSLTTVNTVKEYTLTYKPLLLARFDFTDASILRVCSAPLNLSEAGQTRDSGTIENIQYYEDTAWVDYLGRILNQRVAASQALSAEGIQITPSVTLDLADPDGYIWSTFEGSSGPGFKGAKLTLRFAFWEPDTRNFSTDFVKVFYGICEPPSTTESVLTVTAQSMLNFSHVELPRIKIQRRCPWVHPNTTEQKALASTRGSKFYPCGDTAAGNTSCTYTKDPATGSGCVQNGQWNLTTGVGRYGGIQYQAPSDWTGKSFMSGQTEKGKNTGNQAKYDQYIPLVYGGGRYQPPVANVVGDANQTKGEVILGLDQWGHPAGAYTTAHPQYVIVQINGYNVPFYKYVGGALNAFWAWVNTGSRDGEANGDTLYDLKGDPYGNIAALTFMVVNNIARSDTVPEVIVKLGGENSPVGRQVKVYTNPTTFTWKATLNPVWIIYDLLVEGGWDEDDIDKQTFIDAAGDCDTTIAFPGVSSNRARFAAHLILRDPELMGSVLRGLLNACRGTLVLRELLEFHIRGPLGYQQPSAISGSNDNTAYSSQDLAGSATNGYVAYLFDDSNILRDVNGESSLRMEQLTGDDAPNRITIRYQDSTNDYRDDSLTVLDNGDILRMGGKEVTATFPVIGLHAAYRGIKVLRTLMAELHRGNPRTSGINDDGTSGTWVAIFRTTVKALHLKADHLIHLTSTRYALTKQLFRIQRITPSPDFEEIEIEASWHEDEWYIDSFGQDPEPDYSNPARDRLPRAPWPWQPYGVKHPKIADGETRDDPLFPGEWTFRMGISGDSLADGTISAAVRVTGKLPINSFATGDAMPPHVDTEMEAYTSGGTLTGEIEWWACVCGVTSDGKFTAPSRFAKVLTGSGNACRAVLPFVEWGAGVSGYAAFLGPNPNRLSLFEEATFGTPPTQLSFTSHQDRVYGVPDVEADRFELRVKRVHHSGVWGQAIDDIPAPNQLTIAGAGWTINELAGRVVSILSDYSQQTGAGGDMMPPKHYLVESNTDDTMVLRGADLTADDVEVGDAAVMRFSAEEIGTGSTPYVKDTKIVNDLIGRLSILNVTTSDTNTIRIHITRHGFVTGSTVLIADVTGTTEANGLWEILAGDDPDYFDLVGSIFTNPYAGGGWVQVRGYMPNFHVGRLLRIIAGTGRGALARITSNTQDTIYVDQWQVTPDATSIWIIEDTNWVRSDATEPFSNYTAPTADDAEDYAITADINNYRSQVFLASAVLLDGGGNASFDNPVREMYFHGLSGSAADWHARILDPRPLITTGEDLATNWYRVDVEENTTIELIEVIGQLKEAPNSDLVVDILVSIDEGENFTSLFGDAGFTIPAGELTDYTMTFAVRYLQRGNIIRYDVLQASGGYAEFAVRGRKIV